MPQRLPLNIQAILSNRTVETERIEYKAGWNPDPTIRTLCAFANDFENLNGGYILVGVDCDKSGRPVLPPIGIPENQLDEIQQELLAACQLIRPQYFPQLYVEKFADRTILVLAAPGGMTRPYKAPASVTAKHKSWHYYIRRFSSTVEAKDETERELLAMNPSVPFDDRYAQQADPADLSPMLMLSFLHRVGSELAKEAMKLPIEELGQRLNVVGGAFDVLWPKNVGLLFFSESPDKFIPYAQIDVVTFPEGAGGDRFEERIFKGPLPDMIRSALRYIVDSCLHETVIMLPQRAEALRFWNFPYRAIEEALVNAIYHRSYEVREPIEVRVSPDEIVIVSYPGPDRSIKMADLRAGKAINRRYRNRRIGEFLKELEMTEGRSTGIPKILHAMAQNGSPPPEFETDDDRTGLVVRLRAHPLAGRQQPPTTGHVWPHATSDATGEVEAATGEVEAATGEVEAATGEVEAATGEVAREVEAATGVVAGEVEATTGKVEVATGEVEAATGEVVAATGEVEVATGEVGAATGEVAGEVEAATAEVVGEVEAATVEVAGEVEAVTVEAAGEVVEASGEVARLLAAMTGDRSRQELQQAMGLRHEEHFRKTYLKPALELGMLEMTNPDKPRSRLQRYRLTELGHQTRKALERTA